MVKTIFNNFSLVSESSHSTLEYAASVAGIKPSDHAKTEVINSREVSQQHHYPSPFSQVTF